MLLERPFVRVLVFVSLVSAACAGAVVLGWSSYGAQINQYATDHFFRLRGAQSQGVDRIAIVAIDDETLAQTGNWPLDRGLVARALAIICSGQPAVVGLDLLFSEASNPVSDNALAGALRACPQTVLVAHLAGENVQTLEARHWSEPLAEFAQAVAGVGHPHADPDEDGVCREILLAKSADRRRRWALTLEMMRVAARHNGEVVEDAQSLVVGANIIPASSASQRVLRINYAGPEGAFPRHSLAKVVRGEVPPATFQGKAVLLGVTAQSLPDRLFTPASGLGRGTPGVEIHANALRTMMTGLYLHPLRDSTVLALMVAIAVLVAVALLELRRWPLVAALALIAAAVHVVPYTLFVKQQVIAPLFSLALAFWAPLLVGGAFQYGVVWRRYEAADATSRRMRDTLKLVAHEVQSPLTAIQASNEVLSRYQLDDERRRKLSELISSESQRLGTMVRRFLDVERLEAGEIELRKDAVLLRPLVERTLRRVQPLADRKSIALNFSPATEPATAGDTELLEFAVYNLLSNAVKYSPEQSGVDVTLRSNRAMGLAFVDVRDQGEGIPPAEQPRIFERFYRTETAKSSGQGGLGLGLSIVREIARLHGGSVVLDSVPGRGSKFSLALPLK